MKVENKFLDNGDLEIKLTFDLHDQHCLNDSLVDIVEWYSKGPSSEKIHNCKDRMIKENKEKLLSSPEMQDKSMKEINSIISDEKSLIEAIVKMPGYKCRKDRV